MGKTCRLGFIVEKIFVKYFSLSSHSGHIDGMLTTLDHIWLSLVRYSNFVFENARKMLYIIFASLRFAFGSGKNRAAVSCWHLCPSFEIFVYFSEEAICSRKVFCRSCFLNKLNMFHRPLNFHYGELIIQDFFLFLILRFEGLLGDISNKNIVLRIFITMFGWKFLARNFHSNLPKLHLIENY